VSRLDRWWQHLLTFAATLSLGLACGCATSHFIEHYAKFCEEGDKASCWKAEYYRASSGDVQAGSRLIDGCEARDESACEQASSLRDFHIDAYNRSYGGSKIVSERKLQEQRTYEQRERERALARERLLEEQRATERKKDDCRQSIDGSICRDEVLKLLDEEGEQELELAAFFARHACAKRSPSTCEILADIRARLDQLRATRREIADGAIAREEAEQTRELIRRQQEEQRDAERRRAIGEAIGKLGENMNKQFQPKRSMTCKKDYFGTVKCTEN
jgi:hypothetical protein